MEFTGWKKSFKKIKKIVEFDFGVGYSHDSRSIEFVKKALREKKYLEFIKEPFLYKNILLKHNGNSIITSIDYDYLVIELCSI